MSLAKIVELWFPSQKRGAEDKRAKENHRSSGEIGKGRSPGSNLLGPVGAVERTVLDGFTQIVWRDGVGAFQVGDGAGHFEDAVVGAGRWAQALNRGGQIFFAIGIDRAVRVIFCR
jgi:hypothetical protein